MTKVHLRDTFLGTTRRKGRRPLKTLGTTKNQVLTGGQRRRYKSTGEGDKETQSLEEEGRGCSYGFSILDWTLVTPEL